MKRTVLIVAMLGTLVACQSGSSVQAPPVSQASTSTSTSTSTSGSPGAPPPFVVVLDDQGLHLPKGPTLAGHYEISFADRRTSRERSDVATLQFRPSGPPIVLQSVAAGTEVNGLLLQNEIAQVDLNGALLRDYAIENQLDVRPTPEFSTPVT